MKPYAIRNALAYIGMAVATWSLLPEQPTATHWLGYATVWLLFFLVDLDSYRAGLELGSEIVNECIDTAFGRGAR